jgi:hypothetical protein
MQSHQLRHLDAATLRQLVDDDDAFEVLADGCMVLKPGRSFRTPMRAMDSIPRTKIGDGRANLAANRPGWRVSSRDAQRGRDWSCYDSYDKEISQAYLTPTGEGSGEFIGQRVGDLCTVDGYTGRLVKNDDGELVCRPDHASGRDHRTLAEKVRDRGLRMQEEIAAYDRWVSNQWRRG